MMRTLENCILCALMIIALSACGNDRLRYIDTGYSFEYKDQYHQPERYFSEDTLSFEDYQNIVRQYTARFGQPIYSGDQDEAMEAYNKGGAQYCMAPSLVWAYATDAEYYTIYNHETEYLLILYTHHCGIFIGDVAERGW